VPKRHAKPQPTPSRQPPGQKPAWTPEGNSGEGAASALAILQKLEKRRGAGQPANRHSDDDPVA